ncbi:ORF144 [Ranid herpesvirus 2]|uniref:ORF144 n=1 Tax=Ranid herpesvirus 2 TaxID=389214 RepID=Q14VW2_9VIRU|nr:ORF144 [Ranid herpesvirus 2]ABG25594.1 ORF144 [Ranid herpesvirus 2]
MANKYKVSSADRLSDWSTCFAWGHSSLAGIPQPDGEWIPDYTHALTMSSDLHEDLYCALTIAHDYNPLTCSQIDTLLENLQLAADDHFCQNRCPLPFKSRLMCVALTFHLIEYNVAMRHRVAGWADSSCIPLSEVPTRSCLKSVLDCTVGPNPRISRSICAEKLRGFFSCEVTRKDAFEETLRMLAFVRSSYAVYMWKNESSRVFNYLKTVYRYYYNPFRIVKEEVYFLDESELCRFPPLCFLVPQYIESIFNLRELSVVRMKHMLQKMYSLGCHLILDPSLLVGELIVFEVTNSVIKLVSVQEPDTYVNKSTPKVMRSIRVFKKQKRYSSQHITYQSEDDPLPELNAAVQQLLDSEDRTELDSLIESMAQEMFDNFGTQYTPSVELTPTLSDITNVALPPVELLLTPEQPTPVEVAEPQPAVTPPVEVAERPVTPADRQPPPETPQRPKRKRAVRRLFDDDYDYDYVPPPRSHKKRKHIKTLDGQRDATLMPPPPVPFLLPSTLKGKVAGVLMLPAPLSPPTTRPAEVFKEWRIPAGGRASGSWHPRPNRRFSTTIGRVGCITMPGDLSDAMYGKLNNAAVETQRTEGGGLVSLWSLDKRDFSVLLKA